MISKLVTIENEQFLSPQKAAKFVEAMNHYESKILLEQDNKKVNGKSIMGILTLKAHKGDSILIKADGLDEIEAIDKAFEIIKG